MRLALANSPLGPMRARVGPRVVPGLASVVLKGKGGEPGLGGLLSCTPPPPTPLVFGLLAWRPNVGWRSHFVRMEPMRARPSFRMVRSRGLTRRARRATDCQLGKVLATMEIHTGPDLPIQGARASKNPGHGGEPREGTPNVAARIQGWTRSKRRGGTPLHHVRSCRPRPPCGALRKVGSRGSEVLDAAA